MVVVYTNWWNSSSQLSSPCDLGVVVHQDRRYGPFITVQITPAKPLFSNDTVQDTFNLIGCRHSQLCCVQCRQEVTDFLDGRQKLPSPLMWPGGGVSSYLCSYVVVYVKNRCCTLHCKIFRAPILVCIREALLTLSWTDADDVTKKRSTSYRIPKVDILQNLLSSEWEGRAATCLTY